MAKGISIRVYRGSKASVAAARAETGTPMLADDTQELFFGTGMSTAPQQIKLPVAQVTGLLSGGKIRADMLPALDIANVIEVADMTARAALTIGDSQTAGDVYPGDMVNVLDSDGAGNPALFIVTSAGGYTPVVGTGGGGGISSINGKTGPSVVLTSDDVDEGTTNLYYTDTRVGTFIATQINKANGIAGLDASGKLAVSVLPASVVQAGDDAKRMGSGSENAGKVLTSDGSGGTSWATIDGGTF